MITADANGMLAIRHGDWKYIDDTTPDGLPKNRLENVIKSFKPQLYNLADDPGEQDNLFDPKHAQVNLLKKHLTKIKESGSSR